MTENTDRWPLDYDEIKRGDYIAPETLANILNDSEKGIEWPDPQAGAVYTAEQIDRWKLAVMNLANRVERDLTKLTGRIWKVTQEKGGLRVHTDESQSDYAAKDFASHIRRARRAFADLSAVDILALPADKRASHERRLFEQGIILQHIKGAKRQLRIEPHQRTVPGLIQ